jgi:DNA-binding NarL/FixJ family response regulator
MNILIVDDDKLVSSSLKIILEATNKIKVLAIGNNGKEALELYGKHLPDILLMDIRMNEMSGLEAAEIIINKHKNAKVLFLTTFADDDYIIKALKIGARGYILKQGFESIVPSLEAVLMGQIVFGEEIINKIPSLISSESKVSFSKFDINEKEEEIISKVAEGLSNKEIANVLYLSEGTVRNYISVILEKLNLRDRTQLAIFWYKNK